MFDSNTKESPYDGNGGYDDCYDNVTHQEIGDEILSDGQEVEELSIWQFAEYLTQRNPDLYSKDTDVALRRFIAYAVGVDPQSSAYVEAIAELAESQIPDYYNRIKERVAEREHERRNEE